MEKRAHGVDALSQPIREVDPMSSTLPSISQIPLLRIRKIPNQNTNRKTILRNQKQRAPGTKILSVVCLTSQKIKKTMTNKKVRRSAGLFFV